jgi:hypothetical protein
MNASEAANLIELLANGRDPFSGEQLPNDSPLQHPQVIRALFNALQSLGSEEARSRLRGKGSRPGRQGESWSELEDERLVLAFQSGASIAQVALQHQRTRGAIVSRLVRLGFVPRKSQEAANNSESIASLPPVTEKWWHRERPQAGTRWSDEDDAELKGHFRAGLSAEEIGKLLGRGTHGVEVRLCKLGLTFNTFTSTESNEPHRTLEK